MRIYTIDDDRNFICEIVSGKSEGRIIWNLQTGFVSCERPLGMPMFVWCYHIMEFAKIVAKMYKPSPDKFNVE